MKILIPTDFSNRSKVAVRYAVTLAKKLEAEIILLHAVHFDAPARAAVSLKKQSIEDSMVENAEQDGAQLLREIQAEHGTAPNIHYEIIRGLPMKDAVSAFAHKHAVSLIVMGTKGATGLDQVLLGSNAAAMVNASSIPVITVPEFAHCDALKHIVYATDMQNAVAELKALIPWAKAFDATIHALHIAAPGSPYALDTDKTTETLIQESGYPNISFQVAVNDDVVAGLDVFIAQKQADLLAMFTHDLTFFEKLFGQSVTRKMAFQSNIPLLTMKK